MANNKNLTVEQALQLPAPKTAKELEALKESLAPGTRVFGGGYAASNLTEEFTTDKGLDIKEKREPIYKATKNGDLYIGYMLVGKTEVNGKSMIVSVSVPVAVWESAQVGKKINGTIQSTRSEDTAGNERFYANYVG